MIEEIWKDVEGYEGLYQISNYGNLRSLVDKYGRKRILILKFHSDKKGYLQTRIYKNHKGKTVKIHRLVAEAFIPNPYFYPMINHKDENKMNNFVFINPDGSVNPEKSNLEWCSNSYNQLYGTLPDRKRIINTNHPSKSKRVVMFDENWNLLRVFPSCAEAQRQTGIWQSQITKACRDHMGQYSPGGNKWMFWDDYILTK